MTWILSLPTVQADLAPMLFSQGFSHLFQVPGPQDPTGLTFYGVNNLVTITACSLCPSPPSWV